MPKSTVYLVGAGPGDSALITIKGLELIKKADCIIYDYLVNPELLKFRKNDCKIMYVGKKAGLHTLTQDEINRLLVKTAKLHTIVVRLKGGDPFVFGRGAEEAAYLKRHKIDFNIVPGVTSAIAVPAYAGIPITERSRNSTVGFITGHEDPTKIDSSIDWSALVKALGTMVFLMGVGNLGLIVKKLLECGKPAQTPVALIRWGTTAKQKTVTGILENIVALAEENKITPPVIIVVGETVALRKELNWFENKPLFAKRIIVTRTREQSSRLSEKLRESGAEVIEIPTIKIVSLQADTQLKNAFSRGAYDWIFFTSQNGVHEFSACLERIGLDSRILAKSKICAIGPETAKSLRSIGIKPDYVPQEFVAEAIVAYFKVGNGLKPFPAGKKTLILRAKKARDILPEGLKKAGFEVKVIDVYDTVLPKESALELKEAFKETIDYVTFTSSSTVENFIKLLGKDYRRKLKDIKCASIGPVTSSTLEKHGLKADVEAKVYTIDGLVDAMIKM
jgi:uroporphyrinogen III methyltransferase/synthase